MIMKSKKRQLLDELTFGEKLSPVLSAIEDAILERCADFPGDRPLYPDNSILSAMTIFQDVLLDKAFIYWLRLGLTHEQMIQNAERIGDELRLIVFRYADYDTLKRR